MTRAQAEANWIWNPLKGDLRPKEWPKTRRIRCTNENIKAQQKLARPGKLIHTAAKTLCNRKRSKIDEWKEGENVVHLSVATFIDNVNCLQCRRDYYARP